MLIVSIVITNDCSQNGGNKLAADLRIELAKLGLVRKVRISTHRQCSVLYTFFKVAIPKKNVTKIGKTSYG